jgi:hypothetical protein
VAHAVAGASAGRAAVHATRAEPRLRHRLGRMPWEFVAIRIAWRQRDDLRKARAWLARLRDDDDLAVQGPRREGVRHAQQSAACSHA